MSVRIIACCIDEGFESDQITITAELDQNLVIVSENIHGTCQIKGMAHQLDMNLDGDVEFEDENWETDMVLNPVMIDSFFKFGIDIEGNETEHYWNYKVNSVEPI